MGMIVRVHVVGSVARDARTMSSPAAETLSHSFSYITPRQSPNEDIMTFPHVVPSTALKGRMDHSPLNKCGGRNRPSRGDQRRRSEVFQP
jgi:hypothetical protein